MGNFHCTSLDTYWLKHFEKVFKKFNKFSLTWPIILSLSRFRFLLSSLQLSFSIAWREISFNLVYLYSFFSFCPQLVITKWNEFSVLCDHFFISGLVAYFRVYIILNIYNLVMFYVCRYVNNNRAGWRIYKLFCVC